MWQHLRGYAAVGIQRPRQQLREQSGTRTIRRFPRRLPPSSRRRLTSVPVPDARIGAPNDDTFSVAAGRRSASGSFDRWFCLRAIASSSSALYANGRSGGLSPARRREERRHCARTGGALARRSGGAGHGTEAAATQGDERRKERSRRERVGRRWAKSEQVAGRLGQIRMGWTKKNDLKFCLFIIMDRLGIWYI